ncbi:MAG: POTRA domain-containing protein [Candidatus Latescibacterota bacterium]
MQGNRFTREYVIRRELRSAIGSPLYLKVLREDLQRLDNLDIFSSRRMLARTVDDGVALTLDVREIPFAISSSPVMLSSAARLHSFST